MQDQTSYVVPIPTFLSRALPMISMCCKYSDLASILLNQNYQMGFQCPKIHYHLKVSLKI